MMCNVRGIAPSEEIQSSFGTLTNLNTDYSTELRSQRVRHLQEPKRLQKEIQMYAAYLVICVD